MKKFLSVLMAASFGLAMAPTMAETAVPAAKKAAKKTVKHASAKKTVAAHDDHEQDADVSGTIITEYGCAQGRQITVFRNPTDPSHAAIRWGNRISRMNRVETESGAERLEHEKRGLVFIGIPAKAMLLDAKNGRQLANDCMSPEQVAANKLQ